MHQTNRLRSLLASIAVLFLAQASVSAVTVSFVGANPVGSPDASTEFNGLLPTLTSAPQTVDDFIFAQPFGDGGTDIWTTFNPGGGNGKGWYPNGGDSGYTEITLTAGGNFGDVALFVGSGNGGHGFLAYDILSGGTSVAAGVLSGHTFGFHWLSIAGGGFDKIRLRDGNNAGISVGDGSHNALAFDKVYATTDVPEGSTSLLLLGLGLAALVAVRRR